MPLCLLVTIKVHKCKLGMATCIYLGHVVGGGFLRPEHAKVEVIQRMPIPQTKIQLRAFLGLSGYYQQFITGYPIMALPLTDLTKKTARTLVWTSECNRAFYSS